MKTTFKIVNDRTIIEAIDRKFLVVDENIELNHSNDYKVTRYFNPNHFNIEEDLTLNFKYCEAKEVECIIVKAIYMDSLQPMADYDALEFTGSFPPKLSKILKQDKLSVQLKIKQDTKLLWKIELSVKPVEDVLLHLLIS